MKQKIKGLLLGFIILTSSQLGIGQVQASSIPNDLLFSNVVPSTVACTDSFYNTYGIDVSVRDSEGELIQIGSEIIEKQEIRNDIVQIGERYYYYDGEMENGKANGIGRAYIGNKVYYEGEFKDGKAHGVGKAYSYDRGITFTISCVEGQVDEDIVLEGYKIAKGSRHQFDNFEYIVNLKDNEAGIVGYNGDENYVVIPETIEGMPVTSIEDLAFFNARQMKSILLPSTITHIGEFAFKVLEENENTETNLVIKVYEGSEAEKYLSTCNNRYIELDVIQSEVQMPKEEQMELVANAKIFFFGGICGLIVICIYGITVKNKEGKLGLRRLVLLLLGFVIAGNIVGIGSRKMQLNASIKRQKQALIEQAEREKQELLQAEQERKRQEEEAIAAYQEEQQKLMIEKLDQAVYQTLDQKFTSSNSWFVGLVQDYETEIDQETGLVYVRAVGMYEKEYEKLPTMTETARVAKEVSLTYLWHEDKWLLRESKLINEYNGDYLDVIKDSVNQAIMIP